MDRLITADEMMDALRINPLSLTECYWNIAKAQDEKTTRIMKQLFQANKRITELEVQLKEK